MSETPIELQVLDVLYLHLSAAAYDFDLGAPAVYRRQLDSTDLSPSIGVFFHTWAPVEGPNIGMWEPAIGRYRYGIQTYLKYPEREQGDRYAAYFVKKVRNHLYRNDDLRLGLSTVLEDDGSLKERPLKWGVEQTLYTDDSIVGGFVYLSQTEFYFESEVA